MWDSRAHENPTEQLEEQATSRLTSSPQSRVPRAAFKQEAEAHSTSNCKVRPKISHEKRPSEEKTDEGNIASRGSN